jgi:SAM-dependent methyltransferase
VRTLLSNGGFAVDATLGNGHDTLFLAQTVGENGHVFGFDIQRPALETTQQRLQQHGLQHRVTLYHASHADMLDKIPLAAHGQIQAFMFNLGYLPGADKSLITQSASTILALNACLRLLARRGVITVMAYPGHAGGEQESENLAAWCAELADQPEYSVETLLSTHTQATAPRLFVISKQSILL